jgi:hypothetical protein
MRLWRLAGVVVVIAALSFVFAPKAGAQDSNPNQMVTLTFSQPVRIPGMELAAGTYVFKLLDAGSRNIVQVLNEDQDHVFGTYVTVTKIAGEHGRPPDKVLVTFRESAAGSPPPIDAWWYPGFDDGHAFIYSNERAPILSAAKH